MYALSELILLCRSLQSHVGDLGVIKDMRIYLLLLLRFLAVTISVSAFVFNCVHPNLIRCSDAELQSRGQDLPLWFFEVS